MKPPRPKAINIGTAEQPLMPLPGLRAYEPAEVWQQVVTPPFSLGTPSRVELLETEHELQKVSKLLGERYATSGPEARRQVKRYRARND